MSDDDNISKTDPEPSKIDPLTGLHERFVNDLEDWTIEEPDPKPIGRPRKDGSAPRQRPKPDKPKEETERG